MRKIKVINANLGKVKIVETEATTWGELKAEISDMFSGNVKAVIRETEVSLDSDGAVLPTGSLNDSGEYDFTLFIVTKESKAGSDDYDNRVKWTFHGLRSEVARRGENNNSLTRSELIAVLREGDKKNVDNDTTRFDSIDRKLQLIADALDIELDGSSEPEISAEEMADFTRLKKSI